jgi:lipopolysaccharide export LptBFGC system permease protein LptF
MEIVLGLSFFFLFIFVLFAVFAFFLPEWVGITGTKAKEVLEHQQGESDQPASLDEKPSSSSSDKS